MFSFLWRLIARTDIKTCFQHTTQAQHSELFQMTKKFKWGCGKTGKGKHARLDFSQKQIQASRWRGPPTVGWRGAAGKTFLLPLSLFATIFLSFIDINYQIFPPASCPQHTCKKWENIPNMRTWFFCLLQNPINRVSHQIYALKSPLCQKQRKGQLRAGKKGKWFSLNSCKAASPSNLSQGKVVSGGKREKLLEHCTTCTPCTPCTPCTTCTTCTTCTP